MPAKRSPRGRPPDSVASETRDRIVDVARRSFATYGYGGTTNRMIADGAKITTGALYHHFDSKLGIFRAVLIEVEARVQERYVVAEASAETLLGKIEAVMEAFHELNREDASVAQFVGSARIDLRRYPELVNGLDAPLDGDVYYIQLLDEAIERGEIALGDREPMRHFLRVMAVGLTDGVSSDQGEHRMALDGLKFVLAGGMAPKR